MKIHQTIICGAVAAALFAQTPKAPVFVTPEQLVASSFLLDPPAAGSKETAAELAQLHKFQLTRTPAQIEAAKADDVEEDIFIYKTVLGEKFNKEALPLTAAFSAHLHSDESVIVNPAKAFFHRQRPYLADTTMQPVCKVKTDPTDYAYPSGHSTTGYLEGFALAMMVPERREEILERADEYAHNRLICGVHYASDTVASKQVAMAMIGVMLTNPKFQEELAAARKETRVRLGIGAVSTTQR